MSEVTKFRTIGKVQVPVVFKKLKHTDLLYFSENPRVFSALKEMEENNPSQETIERVMKKQESVKKLRGSIEANGGLLTPIIVKGNVVLEGNSRLAAYRILAATDPIKWAEIDCEILPDDISEELIFNLLGTIHIIGQTPWSAFEQAGYLYRTKQKSRRPIEAIAKDLGMKINDAKLYIQVYDTMLKNEDVKPTKWSYYFELLKTKNITKAHTENPELDILPTIIKKIKNDEFNEAQDIRKVAELTKSKTQDSREVLEDFLDGEIELDEAVELVSDDNKAQTIQSGFERFKRLMQENDKFIKQQIKIDANFNLLVKQIEDSLKTYIKIN